MATSRVGTLDRRMAIGGAFVGAAGLVLPLGQHRTVIQRGMVGGGLVQFAESEAHFSVFASRLIFARKRKDQEVVVGTMLWVDAAGLTMASTEVTNYRPVEIPADAGQAREVFGTMRVNGEDDYPFSLLLIDAGTPGSSLDTVSLTVGDGARTAARCRRPGSGIQLRGGRTHRQRRCPADRLRHRPRTGVSRPAPPTR